MTEQEWLACGDPAALLKALMHGIGWNSGQVNVERKLRLFACACCRHFKYRQNPPFAAEIDDWEEKGEPHGLTAVSWAEAWVGEVTDDPRGTYRAALLRDIVGNPFRPVKPPNGRIDCAEGRQCPQHGFPWLTPTVLHVAQAIFDDRAFDRMPVLADELEEAGLGDVCENNESHRRTRCEHTICAECDGDIVPHPVLAHCRGDEPCPTGCRKIRGEYMVYESFGPES